MGGKYRLRKDLSRLASQVTYARLVDPFVGGGSTLSTFQASSFLASDSNAELVNFHLMCRDYPEHLVNAMLNWVDSREQFLSTRAARPEDDLQKAVRFLYLNRTAYAGMFRVNRAGAFNVPYGGGGRLVVETLTESIRAHSRMLATGLMVVADFAITLKEVGPGDLVFLDPPYSATGHETFDRYGSEPYGHVHREQFSEAANKILTRGIPAIATLPASEDVLLGLVGWRVIKVSFTRAIPNGEVLLVGGSSKWEREGRPLPTTREKLISLIDDHRKFG